jgi:hypothetical protein
VTLPAWAIALPPMVFNYPISLACSMMNRC